MTVSEATGGRRMSNGVESASKRVLGGFELLAKVGRGGMGTVYKARQLSMDRIVAVKILYPRLAQDRSFIERFKKEAQAAARLNHRHIVQGIDAGEADGYYYFAMEFVDGETVHQIITREGALEERLALSIVRDVARALSHAHRYGIVHRDVKPGNIMLTRGGVVKLCDLGLARHIEDIRSTGRRTGQAVGTPYYISPEQARGEIDTDIRSDIYSLGATLYRMVVGEVPFDAPTPAEILRKHIREPLPWPKTRNPRLSDHICYIIAKMMAKSPEERYQTPAEVVQDIERVLAGEPPSSVGFKFEMPPAVDTSKEQSTRERLARKREGLKRFVEVLQAARAAMEEQNVSATELPKLLRGDLDSQLPQTHLKYGLLLLAMDRLKAARAEFLIAAKLGANTSAYMDKINALAAPRDMAYVRAGEVILGAPETARARKVTLPAFYIDQHPVTNLEYQEFVKANNYPAPPHWPNGQIPPGQELHPVTNVSWDDARSYALWAGKRLPTENEWERAARGGDGRLWPWGNDFDPKCCNCKESNIGTTTPIGQFLEGSSPFGCVDMAGNVWEWTADMPQATEMGAEARDFRVVRGGSFAESRDNVRCYSRRWFRRDTRRPDIGFRCVRDV